MYKGYKGNINNTDKEVLTTATETKVMNQKMTFFTYSCIQI